MQCVSLLGLVHGVFCELHIAHFIHNFVLFRMVLWVLVISSNKV